MPAGIGFWFDDAAQGPQRRVCQHEEDAADHQETCTVTHIGPVAGFVPNKWKYRQDRDDPADKANGPAEG